jgi:large subunit ribosomal protein L29
LKVEEARELPDEELQTRLDEVKEELFNLRFQNATGQLDNYKQLGLLKKDIARITTVLRERELGIEPPPEVTEVRLRRRRKRAEEVAAEAEMESESEEETDTEGRRGRRRRRPRREEGEPAEEELTDETEETEDLG